MHRNELLNILSAYKPRFIDEIAYIKRAIYFIQQNEHIFDRASPLHITASAWVVSPDRQKVLLMHHRKLDAWLQPGGHADGDNDVIRVALREGMEETGLAAADIHLVNAEIFDIDMHNVAASADVPAHGHIDVRFLVEVDDTLSIPGNDESHEVKWIPLYQVLQYNNFRSTYRMLEKTRSLRNHNTCYTRRYA